LSKHHALNILIKCPRRTR